MFVNKQQKSYASLVEQAKRGDPAAQERLKKDKLKVFTWQELSYVNQVVRNGHLLLSQPREKHQLDGKIKWQGEWYELHWASWINSELALVKTRKGSGGFHLLALRDQSSTLKPFIKVEDWLDYKPPKPGKDKVSK